MRVCALMRGAMWCVAAGGEEARGEEARGEEDGGEEDGGEQCEEVSAESGKA